MQSTSTRWPLSALVMGLGLLAWLPAITPTLLWDDTFLLSEAQHAHFWQHPLSPYLDTEQVFASPYFRPLAQLSFALFHWVDAEWQPAFQHALNVGLHLLNGLLLMKAGERLLSPADRGASYTAAFAGSLFVLHPLQVEAVTWISGRPDLLATCLTLLALHALLRNRMVGAAGLWGLALLAKESAAPFGLLGLWSSWQVGAAGSRGRRAGVALERFAFIGVGLLYGLLRHQALAGYTQRLRVAEPLALEQHLLLMWQVPGAYMLRWWQGRMPCMGWELSLPFQLSMGSVMAGLLSTLLLLGLGWGAKSRLARGGWTQTRPTPQPTESALPPAEEGLKLGAWGGAGWLLLCLLPVLQLYRLDETVAERYFYLPSLGWALLTACLLTSLARWGLARGPSTLRTRHADLVRGLFWLLVGAVTALQLLGLQRALLPWASPSSFYLYQAACAPTDARAQLKLGEALFQEHQLLAAERQLLRAHALAPGEAQTLNLLAALALQQKQLEVAEGWLEQSLSIQPDWLATRRLKVSLREAQGQLREASQLLREVLTEQPNRAEDWDWLGELLLRQGQPVEALTAFEQAQQRNPSWLERANLQGIAAMQAGRSEEGLAHFRRLLAQRPAHQGAACNLVRALKQLQRNDPELDQLQVVCEGNAPRASGD